MAVVVFQISKELLILNQVMKQNDNIESKAIRAKNVLKVVNVQHFYSIAMYKLAG